MVGKIREDAYITHGLGLHKQSVLSYIKAHVFPKGSSMTSLRFLELIIGWIHSTYVRARRLS